VRFQPGYQFTLALHGRDSFNQKYLLAQVRQSTRQPQILGEGASGEGSYFDNEFVCIPADVPYRPARIARKPRVEGAQTAIVVGTAGEEIYTDEHARVKVSFPWDRAGEANEKSSCWIHVSNAWAGASWGAMSLPRIGQEVIVDFLEGDPDRPIITGRVYHGTHRSPYPLPQEKTKSTLKSNSSKGGNGFNEIHFEDKKGEV
jgi:type VI secretion system secreted protein VgrG